MGEASDRLVALARVHVSGYTRADGTRVSGYVRNMLGSLVRGQAVYARDRRSGDFSFYRKTKKGDFQAYGITRAGKVVKGSRGPVEGLANAPDHFALSLSEPPEVSSALSNPGYPRGAFKTLLGDAEGYQKNCYKCVTAWELRQRGKHVHALPARTSSELRGIPFGELIRLWGGGEGWNTARDKADAEKIIASYPTGSRFFVGVQYDDGSGHVFAAVRDADGVKFLNPQEGTAYDDRYWDVTAPNGIWIARTNGLHPDPSLGSWVAEDKEAE